MLSKSRPPASLPTAIHIGFMARINRNDALARVRGLIRRQVIAPETAWWFIKAIEDGFAYEIHEGGAGRAYLPGILAHAKANPAATLHLRAGGRIVRITATEGRPRSATLQEGAEELIDAVAPGPRMSRYEVTSSALLITSGVLLAVAAITFMGTSVAVNSVSEPSQIAAATLRTRDLPVWHWPKAAAKGQYVSRVQLSGGRWTTQVSSEAIPLPPPTQSATPAAHATTVPSPLAGKRSSGLKK